MRETFTPRVTGGLGDPRSTFSKLGFRLGRDPGPDVLDGVEKLRHEQQRHVVTPRAAGVEALQQMHEAGCAIGVLTDCPSEVAGLWPSLPVRRSCRGRHVLV